MVRSSLLLFTIVSVSAIAAQDPTAPLNWQAPKSNKTGSVSRKPLPNLQSIACESNLCSAVLQDQVVTVGDKVYGYRVSRIRPETVTLTRGSKQWNLELFTLDIKQ
ncbi:MSHA biogenesis protein MshK [Vibrio sp.]|uniref:MSHA biogenesis protein MshK n=1 Tax=Vibrio sp. TaxID=678 RepID=UPI003D0AF18B